MRRILLWTAALGFLLWEAVAVLAWARSAGGVLPAWAHTWERIGSDWLLLILLTDHLGVAGLAWLWSWMDAERRGWSPQARLGLTVLFIAVGTPALLGYLAERNRGGRAD